MSKDSLVSSFWEDTDGHGVKTYYVIHVRVINWKHLNYGFENKLSYVQFKSIESHNSYHIWRKFI